MPNSDDELDYPAEWGTENFPHPNPYFPAPARALRGIGCLPSLLIFPGVPIALGYGLPLVGFEGFSVVVFIFVFGGIGLLYTFLSLNDRRESLKYWRSGKIVPAVVVEPAKGPDRFKYISMLLPFLLGFIVAILKGFGRTNLITIRYFIDGKETLDVLQLNKDWDKYAKGDYLWVARTRKASVSTLTILAPRKFQSVAVPIEAAKWLQTVMPHDELVQLQHAHPFDIPLTQKGNRIRAKEIKRAAKANTRAMKRELQYGETKRP